MSAGLSGVQNNGIFDFTTGAVVGTTYSVSDSSGNGNPLLQTAASRQPTTSPTLGAVMDGSNDCAGFNIADCCIGGVGGHEGRELRRHALS